ncbi:MAG TPA: IclR family transcriptional regulator [Cupriavidus sp.]|nr:IclR family transcriptional regulator [Cupriavidus sp.]
MEPAIQLTCSAKRNIYSSTQNSSRIMDQKSPTTGARQAKICGRHEATCLCGRTGILLSPWQPVGSQRCVARRPCLFTSSTSDMLQTPPDAAAGQTDGVAAVDRAFAIAVALAQAGAPQTLADLARATGMYKSTLLRLLASLERSSLVVQRPDKRYTLGSLAFLFGRAFEASHGLQEAIYPVMEWLVSKGTESPSFHVPHGPDNRICLLRIDSSHSTLDRVRVGDVLPLRKGAPGKVLIAYGAGAPATADTPVVFTSFGERDPLCGAISSPVFGPGNTLLGALSLSGPLERFSELAVNRMTDLLLEAASRATQALGGRWPDDAAPDAPKAAKRRA